MSYETDAFRGTGLPDGALLDLSYFETIENVSVAEAALDLIDNPAFVLQLGKTKTEREIADLRRAVFRACIRLGVQLTSSAAMRARMLGIVIP